MTFPIISIDRIQRDATAAAHVYTCVNMACPYPFFTDAANVFKEAFLKERKAIWDAHLAIRSSQS